MLLKLLHVDITTGHTQWKSMQASCVYKMTPNLKAGYIIFILPLEQQKSDHMKTFVDIITGGNNFFFRKGGKTRSIIFDITFTAALMFSIVL